MIAAELHHGAHAQSRAPAPDASEVPPIEELLVDGGDARIAIDPRHGRNRYGCTAMPDPELSAFGSSTASTLSQAGLTAAARLRRRLVAQGAREAREVTYARELDRVRGRLLGLLGLRDLLGTGVVFGASGTDLHLFAAQLFSGTGARPALVLNVEAGETGTSVPAALRGHHFSSRSALGNPVIEGAPIAGAAHAPSGELATVPIRLADGTPRPIGEIDADVTARVREAAAHGRRVLLVLADVSKTGMVAPSPACAIALKRELPAGVEVLVDACQLRLAPATVRAYLERGFMVAITGSKFITGPSFAGALLVPRSVRRGAGGFDALRGYSARSDWPRDWPGAERLPDVANFGLLLRWEAAIEELARFRAVPEVEVERVLASFARAVGRALASHAELEPLPVPALDRSALSIGASWDRTQTIFPFVLRHSEGARRGAPLTREETAAVYRMLGERRSELGTAGMRFHLGQPVPCGERDGVQVSALRLCASARLVVEAHERGEEPVIARALAALDKAALLVRALPRLG